MIASSWICARSRRDGSHLIYPRALCDACVPGLADTDWRPRVPPGAMTVPRRSWTFKFHWLTPTPVVWRLVLFLRPHSIAAITIRWATFEKKKKTSTAPQKDLAPNFFFRRASTDPDLRVEICPPSQKGRRDNGPQCPQAIRRREAWSATQRPLMKKRGTGRAHRIFVDDLRNGARSPTRPNSVGTSSAIASSASGPMG